MKTVVHTAQGMRAFVAEFERGRLPKEAWTHQAQLTVGHWYLLHHPRARVLELLRRKIRRHKEAVGTANTDTAGYHETITRLFVAGLADFFAAR